MARKQDPKVPPKQLGQKSAQKLLEAHGWTKERGGKHVVKMTKPGAERPITLPCNPPTYPPGLRDGILRQAGLKPSPSDTDLDDGQEKGHTHD